jgi:alkylation response protein AidB-like acyl-CoA dehydrogenase
VSFDRVRLPGNYLLGEIGEGNECLREILAEIRIMTAALSVGVATAALEEAVKYAKTRVQFGRPIGKFQAIRTKCAEMSVQLETARHYLFYAASLTDRDLPRQKEVDDCQTVRLRSVLIRFASVRLGFLRLTAMPLSTRCRGICVMLGSSSFGGGTSEILSINIGKEMGL